MAIRKILPINIQPNNRNEILSFSTRRRSLFNSAYPPNYNWGLTTSWTFSEWTVSAFHWGKNSSGVRVIGCKNLFNTTGSRSLASTCISKTKKTLLPCEEKRKRVSIGTLREKNIIAYKNHQCSSKRIWEIKNSNISTCTKIRNLKWNLHLQKTKENWIRHGRKH